MKLKAKHLNKLVKNGTTVSYPGEYGDEFISLYTNDWVTNYQIKLRGRKPYLKFVNREKAYR
jgi:hypothetical protein